MANKKAAPRNERSGATAKAKKAKAKKRVNALAKAGNTQKMALRAYKREKKAMKGAMTGAKAQAIAKPQKTALQKQRAQEAVGMARQHYGNDVAKPAMQKTARAVGSTVGKVTNTSKRMQQSGLRKEEKKFTRAQKTF